MLYVCAVLSTCGLSRSGGEVKLDRNLFTNEDFGWESLGNLLFDRNLHTISYYNMLRSVFDSDFWISN